MSRLISSFVLFVAISALGGCSMQFSGSNAYQQPMASKQVASLIITKGQIKLINIDGKSVIEQPYNRPLLLTSGTHQITLYAAIKKYQNNMVVLSAKFKSGIRYTIKSTGTTAWVQTSSGKKVSRIISIMQVNKSFIF